ncbi:hypothetical protein DVH02_26910 [Streptomyces corynorhini]|uniref:Tn3 transposase DDE domain-containing protein n=1 Tax=Streptomyces corynorhini TaxID=2282652 RepID=A0A370B6X0_9ACTN|nr:Tn3 family transposase [Streptomyces corynorhini]RDG35155.1 hypothetical protein DVH02_26910 [Streptomyces corynorhini]
MLRRFPVFSFDREAYKRRRTVERRIDPNKVITHGPDMFRVVSSLATGQARAYDVLRMFGGEGRPTPPGTAFAEYGRIAKTPHLLRVGDSTGAVRSDGQDLADGARCAAPDSG